MSRGIDLSFSQITDTVRSSSEAQLYFLWRTQKKAEKKKLLYCEKMIYFFLTFKSTTQKKQRLDFGSEDSVTRSGRIRSANKFNWVFPVM